MRMVPGVAGFTPVRITVTPDPMVNRWRFNSPVGTFCIEADRVNIGRWELRINGDRLGTYQTPRMAADAVASQSTGFKAWDQLDEPKAPDDLEDWEPANAVSQS